VAIQRQSRSYARRTDGSARREALLLVLTHALAFSVPVLPLVPIIRNIARGTPGIQATFAEAYSGRVAAFDVAVGDDRAAVAGLRRHVDRLRVVRRQLAERRDQGVDFALVDASECFALEEIAFLSEAEEREARVADAVACGQKVCPRCGAMNAQRVLDLGAHWVGIERDSE
jgi:hypothetical protein